MRRKDRSMSCSYCGGDYCGDEPYGGDSACEKNRARVERRIMAEAAKTERKCKTCYGYGLWAIGAKTGMGPMDAADGMPTLECPECKSNANPYKNERKSIQ